MSIVTAPTLQQLTSEFDFIRNSEIEGVKGIWRVDSGKSGPVLGITIHTHGNEPSGTAVLWYFRNHFKIADRLHCGSIFFVLNNLKATENYFSALNMIEGEKKEAEKRKARFCDLNMNRLPADVLNLKNDPRYEVQRAQELWPIWRRFQTAFDIHSTAKETDPMIIACGGMQEGLIGGFPIRIVITNIENVQIGKPAVYFYGQPEGIKTLAIEAGSHENPSSFECAIACTTALIKNLELIEGNSSTKQMEYNEYFVCGSVLFPDDSFETVKIFEMFEPITEGQILAQNKTVTIASRFNGHALMGGPKLKPDSIKEEVLFLSHPVKKLKI